MNMLLQPFALIYHLLQWLLSRIFSPSPPPPNATLRRPRIAIIGAGLTGVSSAAHCVGHGFDVTIFEANGPENLGGIWSRVNSTSGLQIHSLMYRFHPSVQYTDGYPKQHQLVEQIRELWRRYGLNKKTKFHTKVTSVSQDDKKRWVINENPGTYGRFDGVIAAVGTCGDAKMPHLPQQDDFQGEIYHSSDLDKKEAKGKKVIIIGGGASAVEALEWAHEKGAAEISILSRTDKWIIPRNAFVDMLLAFNIFGQETIFSWIPEGLLRIFFYRDLHDMAPAEKGLFTETPMVNSEIFEQIRSGKASWLRGDILHMEKDGIRFNHRAQGVPQGGFGHEIDVKGDVVIMATGFKRPSLSFLPEEVFMPPYQPPKWYLQTFPPEHPSICCNNCTYINAIGTVGNYHIGIYTRLLLMFLIDPLTTPKPWWMERWIDMTTFLKRFAPTAAFDFFTYSELIYWFVFSVAINPFRWKWALFVFFGIYKSLPLAVVEREDKIRESLSSSSEEELKGERKYGEAR